MSKKTKQKLSNHSHYFVIDTETTGLRRPKPISVALIHCAMSPDDEKTMDVYYEKEWYISDWLDEIEPDTIQFLKIDVENIRACAIPFSDFCKQVDDYISKSLTDGERCTLTLVAHNAQFDQNVLANAGYSPPYPWFCTMLQHCARQTFKCKYPKLIELAQYHHVPCDVSKCHNALYDAQICAEILFRMILIDQ